MIRGRTPRSAACSWKQNWRRPPPSERLLARLRLAPRRRGLALGRRCNRELGDVELSKAIVHGRPATQADDSTDACRRLHAIPTARHVPREAAPSGREQQHARVSTHCCLHERPRSHSGDGGSLTVADSI